MVNDKVVRTTLSFTINISLDEKENRLNLVMDWYVTLVKLIPMQRHMVHDSDVLWQF